MSGNCLKIGLTGGIGSGKTTVSKVFATLGVPIYYSDTRASELINLDSDLIIGIKNLLGEDVYNTDSGKLDKVKVARLIFKDKELLEKMNNLVHPVVKADLDNWLLEYRSSPYIIQESALVFERGINKRLDKVILVTSPTDLKIKRVQSRDTHRSIQDIEKIMAAQWTDEKKVPLADYIIKNDDDTMIISQALAIHKKLIARA